MNSDTVDGEENQIHLMQFAAAKYKITYTALSVSIVCIFSEFIGFILIVFQHPLFRDLYFFYVFGTSRKTAHYTTSSCITTKVNALFLFLNVIMQITVKTVNI